MKLQLDIVHPQLLCTLKSIMNILQISSLCFRKDSQTVLSEYMTWFDSLLPQSIWWEVYKQFLLHCILYYTIYTLD